MAASYPSSLKTFTTYQGQPGPDNLTIDTAHISNEIHEEIIAIEQTIGARPYVVPGSRSIGSSINYLYYNKAPGRVDSRGSINPLPPPSHNHPHAFSAGLSADDHPQYMRVDGARPFGNPVVGHNATLAPHLITLAQAQGAGLNSSQVATLIQQRLHNTSDYPITGPTAGRWKMAGGQFSGYTDVHGILYVDFREAAFSGIQTFVYMKMPFPGGSLLGYHQYSYVEDQLILLNLTTAGASIQFIEDIVVDRQALVALCWMALGV